MGEEEEGGGEEVNEGMSMGRESKTHGKMRSHVQQAWPCERQPSASCEH